MAPNQESHVYRIAGLPPEVDSRVMAKSFLDEFFGSDSQTTVRSLGAHHQRDSMVAIATFSRTPDRLRQGTSWTWENAVHLGNKSLTVRLEIDTSFLGFTPLNTVSGDDRGTIDFIAVSSLSSHPFGSWKQRGDPFMWLVDDDDCVSPNVRTLLYGYDSSLFSSMSFQDLCDIENALASAVTGLRPQPAHAASSRPRPIVFLAHSLGGLVVKQAICHLSRTDPANTQCVHGLVFFGVPHDGLLVEPWLRIMGNEPNWRLIDNLRPGSRVLQRLSENFIEAFTYPSTRVISIFETLQSRTTIHGAFQKECICPHMGIG
ncbi:hypothetical protein MFIFM68171_02158 [Madurella fahalii]|uniref:AB hydrolase-1 domain-containing protein n=1 Tax=Madurella fahalii TaxID=1157608 RepID=A0ABQ0G2F3_9PEZI